MTCWSQSDRAGTTFHAVVRGGGRPTVEAGVPRPSVRHAGCAVPSRLLLRGQSAGCCAPGVVGALIAEGGVFGPRHEWMLGHGSVDLVAAEINRAVRIVGSAFDRGRSPVDGIAHIAGEKFQQPAQVALTADVLVHRPLLDEGVNE